MNYKIFRLAAVFALLGTLLVCASAARADELIVSGSGNPEFALGQLARAFNAKQSRHRVVVPVSNGTGGAVGGISFDQALGIYEGRHTNWRELGGKPGPIRAVGREATDASRSAINAVDKRFANLKFADGVKVVHLDPHMMELLDRYPTSFGFLNQSALLGAKTRLHRLTLESVEPSNVNIAAGRYPIMLEFGFIHKTGPLPEAARQFLDFVTSEEGSKTLQQYGVIPILK